VTLLPRVLIATLAWGALTGGARFPWAYWPMAVVCAAIGGWALVASRGWRRGEVQAIAWPLGAVGAAIALQATPLPRDVFVAVAPAADRFLQTYSVGYAFAPSAWHATSIDPQATLVALGLFCSFALLLAGLVATLHRQRLSLLSKGLAALGVILAAIGVVQRAAVGDQPLVYGVFQSTPLSAPFGPFLNRNHYAGWMAMAIPVVLGYACAVMEQSRQPRTTSPVDWLRWSVTPDASRFMTMAFALLAMSASLIVTGSRSGVVSLAAAIVAFGTMMGRRAGAGAARRLAAAALVVLFLGAVVWAGPATIVDRFSAAGADLPGRVTAWRDAVRIAADFPIFGSGLGTFGPAMIVYQSGSRISMYAQAHNDYLQLAAEGGAIVVVPALALAFIFIRQGRDRWREARLMPADDSRSGRPLNSAPLVRWIRIGAVAGLVAIAVQSTMEYSLQRPGNTLLCVLLIGLALQRVPSAPGTHAHRV
jgi:O-antigen ligase